MLLSHFFLTYEYIQQGGGISSNSKQASSAVRVFIRHLLRFRLSYIVVEIVCVLCFLCVQGRASIPAHLVCPITHELFVDPVNTILGYTYEREYIEKWFEKHNTDPLTNEHVGTKFLSPNRGIKDAVKAFQDNIVANLPATQSKAMTNQDYQLAMNTKMEELESAIQSKGSRLNHVEQEIRQLQEGMAAIELRIVECIPDDLKAQLAALERSTLVADKKKASELREKQLIESSPPTVQYYVTVQVSVNGVLNACTSISSEMVRNERRGFAGSIASAIGTFSALADPIPFAKFGLDILKGALDKWDERQQKQAVARVVHIFRGDSTVSSLVAEGVARKMALYRQPKLEEADAKSRQKQQQRKGQAFAKAKEALRHAVNICFQKGETNSAKSFADADSQFILEAVMDGSLAINAGFTSTAAEKAEVITASIVAYFKSLSF